MFFGQNVVQEKQLGRFWGMLEVGDTVSVSEEGIVGPWPKK